MVDSVVERISRETFRETFKFIGFSRKRQYLISADVKIFL